MSKHIVVVDDEPNIGLSLELILEREGYAVSVCKSVAEFETRIGQRRAAAYLLDVKLPDGSGIDLMMVLSNDYGLRGIALSGYGMAEDVAKTEQAGFLAHLVKPINFDQLHRVLEQVQLAAG